MSIDFDDEFTPMPATIPDATPEQLRALAVQSDAVIEEHQELVKLRLERAALQAKLDESEREVLRLKRREVALATRIGKLETSREGLRKEIQELRNSLR
jgi:chromosome segregation ATPase